ncbi:MAG: DUF2318 domain-containing protein [Termitinemataceae bacterium]|nr:MAG: DUF2318 domain-containing protein [Termitinemataceae bacterium]
MKFSYLAFMLILLVNSSFAFAQSGINAVKPVVKDKDLVIPISEITADAAFYPVDIGGTRMEIIAVRAPDGTVRTAFNTCQVCYASGRGFYKQVSTVLQCQNCGNRFRMGQVEMQSGGCNPVPISANQKTVDDKNITISKDFLIKAKGFFANWNRT